MSILHLDLDIRGAMRRPQNWVDTITVNGKLLTSPAEVKAFFQQQLDMGRELLPFGDCDNFDYQKGCLGHKKEDTQ